MTVIDGGVPAVHSAAEHVHRPIEMDEDVLCIHCLTAWPCYVYVRYIKSLEELNDTDKSTKEETVGRAHDGEGR